jgi:predicted kinase
MLDALILVYWFPGVGKSAVAPRIAEQLEVPRLAKDTIREAMWDALRRPPLLPPLMWSRQLGAAAYEAMSRAAVELGPRLLLEAPLDPERHRSSLLELAPTPIEIFLFADAELVYERHRERLPRQHACHLPHPLPTREQVIAGLETTRPLRLGGPLLEVDLSTPYDVAGVTAWARQFL